MVLVEDRARAGEVEVVLRDDAPREARDPLDVRPQHRALGRVGIPALQALELLLGFLRHLLGNLLLLELLPVAGDLVREVVGVAELLLDRLELLPQEVLALRLVDLPARRPGDLLLHRQDADLPPQDLENGAQALDRGNRLEDPLRLLHLQLEVRGGEVGEARGVFEAGRDEHHLLRDLLAEGDRLLETFLHAPDERLELLRGRHRRRLHDARHLRAEVGLLPQVRVDLDPREPLHEEPDPAVGELQHPHHRGGGAGLEEVGRPGILDGAVALGDEDEDALLRERRIDGGDRLLARDRERHDDVGEEDDVLQREDGKDVGDRDGLGRCRRRLGRAHECPATPRPILISRDLEAVRRASSMRRRPSP